MKTGKYIANAEGQLEASLEIQKKVQDAIYAISDELSETKRQIGETEQAYRSQKSATEQAEKEKEDMASQRDEAIKEAGEHKSWANIGYYTVAVLCLIVLGVIIYIVLKLKARTIIPI